MPGFWASRSTAPSSRLAADVSPQSPYSLFPTPRHEAPGHLSGRLVMNVTRWQTYSSDMCQLPVWRPAQPLGYLASGNCSQSLCVEVTGRYSLGQLLVGNLAKSTQPQVAFSTRRKREPLQEQRP